MNKILKNLIKLTKNYFKQQNFVYEKQTKVLDIFDNNNISPKNKIIREKIMCDKLKIEIEKNLDIFYDSYIMIYKSKNQYTNEDFIKIKEQHFSQSKIDIYIWMDTKVFLDFKQNKITEDLYLMIHNDLVHLIRMEIKFTNE